MGLPKYSYGYEWTNGRGQVFVYLPDHPMSRADGFYARARFVIEEALATSSMNPWRVGDDAPELGHGPYYVLEEGTSISVIREPRFLRKEERVYHLHNVPGDDGPTNLMLFPSQKAIMQFRSAQYHSSKDLNYKDRLRGLTQVQKDLREEVGVERAWQKETRRAAAINAHKKRKARLAKEAREQAKAEKDARTATN